MADPAQTSWHHPAFPLFAPGQAGRVAEVDSRGYAAMRRAEYPSVEDQLDAAWKARHGDETGQQLDKQIEEIRNRYPGSDSQL